MCASWLLHRCTAAVPPGNRDGVPHFRYVYGSSYQATQRYFEQCQVRRWGGGGGGECVCVWGGEPHFSAFASRPAHSSQCLQAKGRPRPYPPMQVS